MIEHDCPIEGEIMIEKNKPCNWCDELDQEYYSNPKPQTKQSKE